MSQRQRIYTRNRTERLSELLDWKNLGIVSLIVFFLITLPTVPCIFPNNFSSIVKRDEWL